MHFAFLLLILTPLPPLLPFLPTLPCHAHCHAALSLSFCQQPRPTKPAAGAAGTGLMGKVALQSQLFSLDTAGGLGQLVPVGDHHHQEPRSRQAAAVVTQGAAGAEELEEEDKGMGGRDDGVEVVGRGSSGRTSPGDGSEGACSDGRLEGQGGGSGGWSTPLQHSSAWTSRPPSTSPAGGGR